MEEQIFSDFPATLNKLRQKWGEVPGTTQDRVFSSDLLKLEDSELWKFWSKLFIENCAGSGYSTRGWYHSLYRPLASLGGEWLDVGSGLGFDGIYFAEKGAHVTFLDIVEDNLKIIERICSFKEISNVEFVVLEEIDTIVHLKQFDVIMAIGSLHHAPYELMSNERKMLGFHLRGCGRWLELCYSKERWMREGGLAFSRWGVKTDGEKTPWAEWYDTPKLLKSLEPHKFNPILGLNFHNEDFIWFDLIKKS